MEDKTAVITDIIDIKGPLSLHSSLTFLFIFLAALLLIAAIVFGILYFLKKRKEKIEAIPPKPAHEIALEALEALKRKDYIAKGKIKEFYEELSFIVRYYLENRFSLKAPEMTTEEFLEQAKGADFLTQEQKKLLEEFLSHCDLVKFAKYGPSEDEIKASFESAENLIEQTKAVMHEN
ncbi:MAG: hypothetical protein ABIH08_01915 [Candidatus Omnitrophota bacterium]